jgi:hypothetical protein
MTKTRKDRLGLVLILALIGCLGAVGGFAAHLHNAENAFDPITLCPNGRDPSAVTEVLLDLTDPLSADQSRALRVRLRHLAQIELRKHELLTIWGVGEFEDGSLRRLFSRCNPGRESNWLYQDPARVEARFDSLFGDSLSRLAKSLVLNGHSPSSPILESIQEISELPEFDDSRAPRRIIVVSDMLQNTGRFSNYRAGSSYAALRKAPAFRALHADLRDTPIEIVYLPRRRDAALQGPEHRGFWRQYLMGCGAQRVEFSRL